MSVRHCAFTLAAVLALVAATPAVAGEARVTICHIPPGNPLNAHTISVGESALQAHLSHGDRTGTCPPTCIDAAACDDANRCTQNECVGGFCDFAPVDCTDGNSCTDDRCDPVAGCTNPPSGQGACSDGDICTENDACDGEGGCAGSPVPGCCLMTQDCTATDPDPCTIEECQGTRCVTVDEVMCTPPDECTVSTCVDGNCMNAPKEACGSCGDGMVQGDEQCDPPDFDGATCEDVLGPGATGTPDCTSSCQLAPGTCQLCGNGIREGTEECDDGNDFPADGCDQCLLVIDGMD